MSRRAQMFLTEVVFLASVFLAGATNSWSQLNTTTIGGTVTDSTGAAVPDATVTITNEGTQTPSVMETNSDGNFIAPGLPVGTYTVSVQKAGFQAYRQTGVATHPSQVTSVDAVLTIGSVSTQVHVSASAVQVQTATPEVSSEVSEKQVQTLPLNGRNFQSLSALMPGVTNMSPDTAQVQGGFLQTNAMSVNGMGITGSNYYVDGIWDMNIGDMLQLSITPNPDSIEEVRVLQNNYSAQYGMFGANQILVQTKSGTDRFHGSAWEYLRNDALNARNFFSPVVPPLKQNIFGFTLGGPVYIPGHYNTDKKKTFFFVTEQWARQIIGFTGTSAGVSTATAPTGADPTAAMRNGAFNTAITDPTTGQPFPQTSPGVYQIPQSRINPDALTFLNAMAPLPNNPAGGFNNYINLNPEVNHTRDIEGKVNHIFSDNLRMMAEYFTNFQLNSNPNDTFLGSPYSVNRADVTTHDQLAQLQLTWIPKSTMVNTVSVNMNNYVVNLLTAGTFEQSQIPNFHETLPFQGFLSERLPQVQFAGGWAPIGQSTSVPSPHSSNLNDTLSDDWSWLQGNHYVQAGMVVSLGTARENTFSASNGEWFFSGQFTGNPIADYLLGDAASFTQASTVIRGYIHYPLYSPYVQDRWKVNRHLTVTAGLRYEFLPSPHPQRALAANFIPSLYNPAQAPIVNSDGTITPTPGYNPVNGLVYNGVNGAPVNFTTSHQNDWAPTVGFAWDVFGNGKTSLRGGYGITYTTVPTSNDCSFNCVDAPPVITTLTLITPKFPSPVGAAASPPGAPGIAAQDLNFYPAQQVQTYSLSLEHQFPGNWLLSVAGAGNAVRHMNSNININQPLPDPPYDFNPIINGGTVFPYVYSPYLGYANITQATNALTQNWNALEVNLRHPIGHNLFLTSSYTWQHCLSEARGSAFIGPSVQDSYHPSQNYGTCGTNVFNVWTSSLIYSLPWFRGTTGLVNQALGGWQFSDITTVQSGFALDPGLATATPGLATRPDRVPGTSATGPKTLQEWFNTNAFAAPAAGYFGNAAPGSIIGPGVFNFDMALYKDFRVKEDVNFQFRAEAFNIFNRANFAGVQTAYGAGNFGAVTAALDPRIFEFALRFQF
ncbi:MAG TPA: carboxypeptidase regulatory-like domain-containing protein [Terriglobia bacterium]|nr:carboxypeptidase regulatory-like domain-containing protein [Terriglobia bacterium]